MHGDKSPFKEKHMYLWQGTTLYIKHKCDMESSFEESPFVQILSTYNYHKGAEPPPLIKHVKFIMSVI